MKRRSRSAASYPRSTKGLAAIFAVVWLLPAGLAAQVATAVVDAEPSSQTADLTFASRPVVTFRARVLGRLPAERAETARRALDDLVAQGVTRPITSRPFGGGIIISVGPRGVVALTAPDVDELAGETLPGVAADTMARLRQALDEAVEARTPALMLRAAGAAALGLAAGCLLLWGIARLRRFVVGRLAVVAERSVTRAGLADAEYVRASSPVLEGVTKAAAISLQAMVIYATCTFVLRRFPYTRPWGESMREWLLSTAARLGSGAVEAIPGLFTALVIFVIARAAVRLVGMWFNAVEAGRIKPHWIYPETAQPTRRLASTLIWLFALIVAYPYLPGSETEAFKGVGIFLGLMVTLGSSGLVNQIMGGFMVVYSRALRLGDFVKIGDVEGTVVHLGMLSTKIRTLKNEEVTIPNAVVSSQTTTDYSRNEGADAALTTSSVTIGYDTPWRQVHALLRLAAERTDGLRDEPRPVVLQEGLEDFYVKYTLMVCLRNQADRLVVMDALHANIQDLFNEHGVQIMSPNYVFDPSSPKIVDRTNWFAAPADPAALNDARPTRP
jgi:small-conductance mechanosensitive channel